MSKERTGPTRHVHVRRAHAGGEWDQPVPARQTTPFRAKEERNTGSVARRIVAGYMVHT